MSLRHFIYFKLGSLSQDNFFLLFMFIILIYSESKIVFEWLFVLLVPFSRFFFLFFSFSFVYSSVVCQQT